MLHMSFPDLSSHLHYISHHAIPEPPTQPGKFILMVDEAHELRNPSSKHYQATFKWALMAWKVVLLTGTPVVNYPRDMAPLINLCRAPQHQQPRKPGFWKQLFSFQSPWFIPMGQEFDDTYGIDGRTILDDPRIRAWIQDSYDEYQHLITNDPSVPTFKSHDILLPMHPAQKKMYDQWLSKTLDATTLRALGALNESSQWDILERHPKLLAFLDGGRRLCNGISKHSPKLDALVNYIVDHPEERMQIYSMYLAQGVDMIAQSLDDLGIAYSLLTGRESSARKQEEIERYNRGEVRIFLMSAAGGQGFTLKQTQSIHLFEPHWNNNRILQVIFRSIRRGVFEGTTSIPHIHIYRYYCQYPTRAHVSADMHLKQWSEDKDRRLRAFLDLLKPSRT